MSTRQRNKAVERRERRAAQEPRAKLRWLRISPRKVRLVVDLIRGLPVQDALHRLNYSSKAAALPVAKLLRSAVANADQKGGYDVDTLVIKTAFVDEGPTWRRWLPRAMGRATRIRKRSSHVTVVLGNRS